MSRRSAVGIDRDRLIESILNFDWCDFGLDIVAIDTEPDYASHLADKIIQEQEEWEEE